MVPSCTCASDKILFLSFLDYQNLLSKLLADNKKTVMAPHFFLNWWDISWAHPEPSRYTGMVLTGTDEETEAAPAWTPNGSTWNVLKDRCPGLPWAL